jgi:hypothetical protein
MGGRSSTTMLCFYRGTRVLPMAGPCSRVCGCQLGFSDDTEETFDQK